MSNKRLNAVITIGGAVSSSLKSAIGSTIAGFDRIGGAIDKLKQRQRELNRVVADQEKLGAAGSALKVQYASQELGIINKQIDALKRKQSIIKQSSEGMAAGSAMMAGGGSIVGKTLAVGAAVGFPLAAAAKRAGDFEYQLQLIGNTADMTKAEIAALGRQVLETSKATGQSSEDTVRGIGFLVAAGMDVKTAAETVKQAGLAATASGGDIEDMARAAYTLNDSLKIPAGAAMLQALDTLAQAGKEGNVELKDMAKQLPVLGAGFVSLKMQGREAAATMAAALEVARKGAADADEAANNMKNFIAKIMSPETLKKAKKNFGIDLYAIIKDAQTKGQNPFEAAMKSIIKATKGDQKAIGELFQDMQVQNFLRPMIQNWEEYERVKNKALSSNGVIDRDAAKMRETQKQQVNEAMNSIGTLGIALGAVLAPAVMQLTGALTPVVDKVGAFVTDHKELIGQLLGDGAVIAGVIGGFGAFKWAIGAVTFAFNALKLAMATNPIGLLVVALTTAAVLIYKNWEPIKAFFKDLWDGVVSGAKAAFDWIGNKVTQWGGVLSSLAHGDVGGALQSARQFFGVGSGPAAGAPAAAAPGALPLPKPAARSSSAYTDNSQNIFNVHQQPGQSTRQLAEEITRIQEQQRAARQRGRLSDGMGAQ